MILLFARFKLLLLLTAMYHPVHVSVSNLEYNKASHRFELSVKLFYDDFESIIARKYNVFLKLKAEGLNDNEEFYFMKYIKENFILTVNGTKLEPVYKFRKINEDSVWLYLYFEQKEEPEHITLTNRLMMDMFSDQSNLLMIKSTDFEKGYILKGRKDKIEIDLVNH